MFIRSKMKFIIFLCLLAPVSIFPALKEKTEEIESLIKDKKYASACRDVRYLFFSSSMLSAEDKELALKFAVDKAKFFTTLDIDENEEELEICAVDLELGDLVRCIIDELSDRSASDAAVFVNDMLKLVYNKWPEIAGLTLEEFYCCYAPDFNNLKSVIDFYLCPKNEDPTALFFDKMNAALMTLHNILGAYLTPGNILVLTEHGDEGFGVSEFGKKYVNFFLTQGYESFKKRLDSDYDMVRTLALARGKDADEDDECIVDPEDTPAQQDLARAILANDRQNVIKISMELYTLSVAGLALSTTLFMKKSDGISYIKNVYNTLIQKGEIATANSLKLYVLNPPMTEEDEDKYGIPNPKHIEDEELIKIPEDLKRAFCDRTYAT